MLLLLSVPILRQTFYEIFLRTHQALAIFTASSVWRHLRFIDGFPWLYIYIYGGVACFLNLVYVGLTVYRNKRRGNPFPRFLVRQQDGGICVTVELSRPVRVEAGQYINLWVWAPAVNPWSWIQTHPFTVISWSPIEQISLELLIEPRSGLTSKLIQTGTVERPTDDASLSYPALFSGPHGVSFPVWEFKTVIMFATGFGIAALLPFLEKLVHGRKFFKGCARRIHLVWHVQDLGRFKRIIHILNHHLEDDAIGKGYVCTSYLLLPG